VRLTPTEMQSIGENDFERRVSSKMTNTLGSQPRPQISGSARSSKWGQHTAGAGRSY
jgi:hypothetical protein